LRNARKISIVRLVEHEVVTLVGERGIRSCLTSMGPTIRHKGLRRVGSFTAINIEDCCYLPVK
jgi:hypothetical protein